MYIMSKYICKIANKKDIIKRWSYLVKIHSNNPEWFEFKKRVLDNFEKRNIITYFGYLDENIISELTVYIKPEAFLNDINDSKGLLSESMAYLSGFRTNKEYENKGFFSTLYKYAENDLNISNLIRFNS